MNLNSETMKHSEATNASPGSNFDLLSGFGGDSATNFISDTTQQPSQTNTLSDNDVFDPFGTGTNNLFNNLNLSNNMQSSQANGNQPQSTNDLFSGLGTHNDYKLHRFNCNNHFITQAI